MTHISALILAYFFLALAIIGVFVPVLPTVPFLLVSAWFSARCSERLHSWLYEHPKFGSILINWEEQGAVSRNSKIAAVLMISLSWVYLFHQLSNTWMLAGITCILLTVSVYLVSRPEPR